MRKLLIVFMVLVVSAFTFAGGSPAEESTSATDEEFVLGETPLTFSFFDVSDVFAGHDYGVDYQGEAWIKENLLVDMELIGSGGAAEQKFSTMIIDGDLPDRLSINRNQLPQLVEAGLVVPLDDYLEGSYFLESMGTGAIDMLRSEDGKLYQYPQWMITRESGNGNGGWLIQKSIHDALGNPPVETFDQLYDYLNLVSREYPDMIPLAVTQNFTGGYVIFTGFAEDMLYDYIASFKAIPEGDELTSIFKSDVFEEALLYTARLFREGLIDPDSFTINRSQDLERLPDVAVVASNNIAMRGRETRGVLQQEDPSNDWIPIWPIRKEGLDPDRVFPNSYNTLGGRINVISSSAENPEGVFRFMDWLFSPYGALVNWFGPPGLYWEDGDFTPEGYPVNFSEDWFSDPADVIRFVGTNRTGIGNTALVDGMSEYFYSIDPSFVNWTKNTQITVAWQTSKDRTEFTNVIPATDSDEGIIFQEIEDIFDEMYSRAMFASSDAEVLSILADADSEADDAGFDQLLDYMTEIWQRDKERLEDL